MMCTVPVSCRKPCLGSSVEINNVFQRGKLPGLEIGCRAADVAQRRHLERATQRAVVPYLCGSEVIRIPCDRWRTDNRDVAAREKRWYVTLRTPRDEAPKDVVAPNLLLRERRRITVRVAIVPAVDRDKGGFESGESGGGKCGNQEGSAPSQSRA